MAAERGDLRYFGIRHEGAAAFAATAYGKLPGLAVSEDGGRSWEAVGPEDEASAWTEKILQL